MGLPHQHDAGATTVAKICSHHSCCFEIAFSSVGIFDLGDDSSDQVLAVCRNFVLSSKTISLSIRLLYGPFCAFALRPCDFDLCALRPCDFDL